MNRKSILSILILTAILSVNISAQKTETLSLSKKVVQALKNRDMKTLATYVHPTKGVRFSPYSSVDKNSDRLIKKSGLSLLFSSKHKYLWGEYDGSGDPINKTFPKYFSEFVYDRDFARAKKVSYENRLGNGNTVFNVKEVYSNAKFVEYHFAAGKDGNEMGWTSLLLVFEKQASKWYLVGIVHDQWTI